MEKIVGGKRYGTETAELVWECKNYLPTNDFRHFYEALYRTSKGAYFVVSKSGSLFKNDSSPNLSFDSSGIIVLTENDALTWLEKHNCNLAIEKYFSNLIEEA